MSIIKSKEMVSRTGIKVKLRSAVSRDSAELVKLNKEIIREGPYMLHEIDEYKRTVKYERNMIKIFSEDPGSLYLVGEISKHVAGYCTFKNGGLKRTKHMGFIALFINKRFRDIGIGKMLMNELISWGKKNQQIKKLSLAVFSTNKRAISLYKRVGFKLEGRCRRDMVINGKYVDSILMYKYV